MASSEEMAVDVAAFPWWIFKLGMHTLIGYLRRNWRFSYSTHRDQEGVLVVSFHLERLPKPITGALCYRVLWYSRSIGDPRRWMKDRIAEFQQEGWSFVFSEYVGTFGTTSEKWDRFIAVLRRG